MKPEARAGWIAITVHLAMYAWWIWADALLSDDYFMFGRAPNFQNVATESFRPLGAMAANLLTAWLQSAPDAVYWAKGLSLALSSIFAGLLAAGFARVTGSTAAGVAMALLVSTNPGIQINSIWLCLLPIWATYVATTGMFCALLAGRDHSTVRRWGLTAALCVVMFVMLFLYQIAPFVLAGAVAAFIVLSNDSRQSIGRVVVPAGTIIVVSMGAYVLALWLAISSGFVVSGRASSAVGGMLDRLAAIQPQQGLFWLNLFLTAKQSAVAVLLFVSAGASIDVWRNGKERAVRWGAASLLTLAVLYVPAALNEFQAARLYSPGAIGVAGLMVASALAIFRELPGYAHAVARAMALVAGLVLGIGSQAAGVIGLGLTQHAELQHVRNQIAEYDAVSIRRVHLIPPPDDSAFWSQRIRDPAHDMYMVRLSSYHRWAREGLVRFALRYLDPARHIEITVGGEAPEVGEGIVIVDMRPADRALFLMPY